MRKMRQWIAVVAGVGMVCLMAGCSGQGAQDGAANRIANTENAIEAAINARGNEEVQENGDALDREDAAVSVDISTDTSGLNGFDPIDAGLDIAEDVGTDTEEQQEDSAGADNAGASTDGIDVDLTVLSGTMVYSEVYNMMAVPDNYVGKTIKMEGAYTYYEDETTGKQYFACVIQDAAACCAQGIEFVPTEAFAYPEDYPQEGEDVTVIGTFSLYEENGFQYATLLDAEML